MFSKLVESECPARNCNGTEHLVRD